MDIVDNVVDLVTAQQTISCPTITSLGELSFAALWKLALAMGLALAGRIWVAMAACQFSSHVYFCSFL